MMQTSKILLKFVGANHDLENVSEHGRQSVDGIDKPVSGL